VCDILDILFEIYHSGIGDFIMALNLNWLMGKNYPWAKITHGQKFNY